MTVGHDTVARDPRARVGYFGSLHSSYSYFAPKDNLAGCISTDESHFPAIVLRPQLHTVIRRADAMMGETSGFSGAGVIQMAHRREVRRQSVASRRRLRQENHQSL
jgi:hypothetical protein